MSRQYAVESNVCKADRALCHQPRSRPTTLSRREADMDQPSSPVHKRHRPYVKRPAITPLTPSALARYWPKVQRGADDECWPWTAFTNGPGYGMFRVTSGRMDLAHRLAWEIAIGPVPRGLWVLHRCDNPPCCNPAHLFLGTHADNMADKKAKGRAHVPQPKKRGEGHPLHKLTSEQVAAIRAADVSQRGARAALARQFGVAPATITVILKGKTWVT